MSKNAFHFIVDEQEVSAFRDDASRLQRGQIAIRLIKGGRIEIRKLEIKELSEGQKPTIAVEN